ncbi:RagB/SusD family nutrient uptake outer membrane protein [Paucihalobacter sp.]|uniref:RagB/SusD family nutrient uptake outer membrane protein n=1 Tax=Paucihalobacter sp. TaxID=2850405 RepID=UPI002FE00411
MKKYNKILFVALLAIFMGCNDAIDIRQPGRLDASTAFLNVTDLESGVLGMLREFDINPEIALASNFCDEISIGFDSGGQGFALYDFVLTPASSAASDFWVRNYRGNNRATILIEAAANVTPMPGEEERYNNVLAEAHAFRAYVNFELLTYFSPNLRDDSSLGAVVVDFIPPLDFQPTRNTTGECWDFINADLAIADQLFSTQSATTRLSKDFIKALRARSSAFRGEYGTTATLAQELLNSYPIANQTQYQLMFLDADNTEIIFKLERTLSDQYNAQGNTGSVATGRGWAGARFAFVSATLDGSPYFEMDRGLYNLMDVPGDVRRTVNIDPSSIINPNYATDPDPVNTDILVIRKYPGSEGQPLMNDLKVFRSAEMLLLLAEARAAASNFTGAAQLIQQLRTARLGSPQPLSTYTSQQQAFAAILQERRIELCFEGHRYKDLKRLGVAANRGVDRDPTDCNEQSGACTLPASDFRFTLPIPLTEINANPGISAQQNPGY